MMEVVGFIKVNESIPQRVRQLVACIHSYAFLKDHARILLALENPSSTLVERVNNELKQTGISYELFTSTGRKNYGETYCDLLRECKSEYILNFFEDHFMILNDVTVLEAIIKTMRQYGVDICKSSFFQVEQNSVSGLRLIAEEKSGKIFINDERNHAEYQKRYGHRFYIGVNFLTSKKFAMRFWGRRFSSKSPHAWEVCNFDASLIHVCMIPSTELSASVDDHHGEIGTSLLERNEEKFQLIYHKAV